MCSFDGSSCREEKKINYLNESAIRVREFGDQY